MQSQTPSPSSSLEQSLPFRPAVSAGGFIYLSGTLATDDSGKIIPGGIQAQTRRVIEKLSGVLNQSGSRLENVASVQVYLKNAADFPSMNEAYRGFWTQDPPTRTTIVSDLVLPDALVEISMVAIPDGGERKVIHPAEWSKSPNPYSYGIQSGDTLFLAGLISRDAKSNSIVEGDITVQTRTVLDSAGAILQAAGMTHADVVSSRVYITDTAHFQDMNAAYRSYFPKDPPARATVRAELMNPVYQVEITLTAVKSESRRAILPPSADGSPARPNPNLSPAIQVGDRLYISGMLGNNETNKGDAGAQTRETMNRIGRTLTAAGFDWSHVVDGLVYLTELQNYDAMNREYRTFFGNSFPARATVGSGLVSPDGLVEIMFIAVK